MSAIESLKLSHSEIGRLAVLKLFALETAKLSKCTKRKVAAVIASRDMQQIYSIGVNGGAAGQEDCLCCTEGKYGCVHAEVNCLIKNLSREADKIMIVTLAPCQQCAAAIINAPGCFSIVAYCEDWKETHGIEMLRREGIEVIKI